MKRSTYMHHGLRNRRVPRALGLICLIGWLSVGGAADGQEGQPETPPVTPVAVLTSDDQGQPLKFPLAVFFDKTEDETYVVSGRGRIVVYGPDYFPRISLGAGRGLGSPSAVYVDNDGRLYVCQGQGEGNPARLTVLNAAFFPVKEIGLDTVEEAPNFSPKRLVVVKEGTTYIAGDDPRGVLVLDREGKFLRWLTPIDNIWVTETYTTPSAGPGGRPGVVQETDLPAETGSGPLEAGPMGLAPEAIVKIGPKVEEKAQKGPVRIIDVATDTQGRLYLLSEETGKVYVYSAGEEFLFSFGQKGGSSGKMSRPRGLAVDEKKGGVYVADYMRHTILVFGLDGRYIMEFGGRGWSPGWFNYPTSVAVDHEGNLIVADLFNDRIQVLDVRFEAAPVIFGPAITGPQGPYPERPPQPSAGERPSKDQLPDR